MPRRLLVVGRNGPRPRAARAALAVVAVTLAVPTSVLLSIGVAPSPAEAAASGACQDKTGVTVVVDFGRLAGGVQVACAPGPVASGLDALERAGFGWTPVASQPSFVCRINDEPADDPCQVTPPADMYWGYWHAESGGTWTYSARGAGSSEPQPGSVEGWAFGDSAKPGVPPPGPYDPPPPPTSPAPSSVPPPAPPPSTTHPAAGSSATQAPIATTSAPATPAPSATTTRPTGSNEVSRAVTLTATASQLSNGPDPAAASSSSPVGTIVGGGLVLLVAGAGGVLAWRRRLSAQE